MSEASERHTMRQVLAAHALMSIPEAAAFLGVDREVVIGMVKRKELPAVPVGRRRRIDPIDAAVHVLAAREGVSPAEYWKRHGQATVERAKAYVTGLQRGAA